MDYLSILCTQHPLDFTHTLNRAYNYLRGKKGKMSVFKFDFFNEQQPLIDKLTNA